MNMNTFKHEQSYDLTPDWVSLCGLTILSQKKTGKLPGAFKDFPGQKNDFPGCGNPELRLG